MSYYHVTMINITANIDSAIGGLDRLQRKQVPHAASMTLNQLAFLVRVEEQSQMENILDRPTPFTKRGVQYQQCTKRNLIVWVYMESKRDKYMKYLVEGGIRYPEKKALLIKTKNSKINKYGNMPLAYRKLIHANKKKFFAGSPRGQTKSKKNEGIWERYGFYGKKSNRSYRIRKVASYSASAGYTAMFDFVVIGEKLIFSRVGGVFNRAIRKALATAE